MAVLFLLFMSTLCIHASLQQDLVEIVRQNFTEKLNFQLKQQITAYITHEVTYRAYASYFERADIALPGFQKFFTSLAKTARKSGFELTELVNMLGGHVTLPVIRLKDGCNSIKTERNKGYITRAVDVCIRLSERICGFLLLDKKEDKKEKKVRKPRILDKKDDRKEKKFRKTRRHKNKNRKPKKRTKRSGSWWSYFSFGSGSAGEATEEQPPQSGSATKIVQAGSPRSVVDRSSVMYEKDKSLETPRSTEATEEQPPQSESATKIVQADSPRYVLDRSSCYDGLVGLEDALALEHSAQEDLISIIKMARKGEHRNPHVYQELRREYLGPHVDSTYRVALLVKRLQRHHGLGTYKLQEYLLDQEINEG